MVTQVKSIIRPARPDDTIRLANLRHFSNFYTHRHLDWRDALELVGEQPFLVLEEAGQIRAALVCPPDPPGIAWIRLFGAVDQDLLERAWQELWGEAHGILLRDSSLVWAAALPMRPWFPPLLEMTGFHEASRVVMLRWLSQPLLPLRQLPGLTIRPMNRDDLPEVATLDAAAFAPIWQNSFISIELAYGQAAIATVAELDGVLVGYQISTSSQTIGHLARLAVLPERQRIGIGSSLLQDVLSQMTRRGISQVSVNTQQENHASLALYRKAGFSLTGEQYPVYQHSLVD